MNKVLIIGFVLVVVLLVGMMGVKVGDKPKEENVAVVQPTVTIESGMVSVNVNNRISMVDLMIKTETKGGSFKINKEVFNSELLNRVAEDGSLHVILGVMKATNELPEGNVVVGQLMGVDDKEVVVTGQVTVPGEGDNQPEEVSVWSKGAVTNE